MSLGLSVVLVGKLHGYRTFEFFDCLPLLLLPFPLDLFDFFVIDFLPLLLLPFPLDLVDFFVIFFFVGLGVVGLVVGNGFIVGAGGVGTIVFGDLLDFSDCFVPLSLLFPPFPLEPFEPLLETSLLFSSPLLLPQPFEELSDLFPPFPLEPFEPLFGLSFRAKSSEVSLSNCCGRIGM